MSMRRLIIKMENGSKGLKLGPRAPSLDPEMEFFVFFFSFPLTNSGFKISKLRLIWCKDCIGIGIGEFQHFCLIWVYGLLNTRKYFSHPFICRGPLSVSVSTSNNSLGPPGNRLPNNLHIIILAGQNLKQPPIIL